MKKGEVLLFRHHTIGSFRQQKHGGRAAGQRSAQLGSIVRAKFSAFHTAFEPAIKPAQFGAFNTAIVDGCPAKLATILAELGSRLVSPARLLYAAERTTIYLALVTTVIAAFMATLIAAKLAA